MKRFIWAFSAIVILLVSGCSKNDDPNNGDYIKPDQNVADPTGTILLSMRNNDDTSLDGLYIGKDDNFHGYNWQIAALGKMKGLGNVSTIPSSGWTDKIAVTPGYGYVAYNRGSDEFYRIYVTDYITSTTGGVIGADIKYQKPFKGLDESIRVKQDKVVLPAEGGSQQVVFENSSIIPFKVTSSEPWCHVQKASTRDESFLSDAIVISCDETYSATEATATITIETLYEKTKEIQVTRASRGEFITLSQESVTFPFQIVSTSYQVNVYTNIEPSDIKVESSEEWLSVAFSGASYAPERKVRWIGNEPATRATLENPVSKALLLSADGYAGADNRTATVTLSYGETKATLTVTQSGSQFTVNQTDFIFEGDSDLTKTVNWSGNIRYNNISIKVLPEGENWITASISSTTLTLTLQPNPYPETRTATVVLMYNNQEIISLNVTQKGTIIQDQYVYFQSPASNYTISFPFRDGDKITSSADWCTATPNGASLVIRATSTTEDRCAVISVEGIDAKIYVSQSKYKVSDSYQVGDISGLVYSMEEGIGKITYTCGSYAWSNENISINGLDWYYGSKNMDIIKAIPSWQELYPAFAAVDELNKDGVSGWYLPACNEYKYSSYANMCWSSNQVSATEALTCMDYYGNKDTQRKTDKLLVIAMKQFSYDFSKNVEPEQ